MKKTTKTPVEAERIARSMMTCSPHLQRALKIQAVNERRPLQELTDDAITLYLESKK
jgi:hypothetical protein